LFRVMLRLQGLGRAVHTDVRVTELLSPYIERMLAERFAPARIAKHALRTGRAWDHLIQTLPEEVQATFERIRTGELGVDFRVRDVDGAIDRLVDGLLASAAILAAAELISRRAGPTIGGISIPGLAVVGVGATTWARLAAKRQGHQSVLQRARAVRSTRSS